MARGPRGFFLGGRGQRQREVAGAREGQRHGAKVLPVLTRRAARRAQRTERESAAREASGPGPAGRDTGTLPGGRARARGEERQHGRSRAGGPGGDHGWTSGRMGTRGRGGTGGAVLLRARRARHTLRHEGSQRGAERRVRAPWAPWAWHGQQHSATARGAGHVPPPGWPAAPGWVRTVGRSGGQSGPGCWQRGQAGHWGAADPQWICSRLSASPARRPRRLPGPQNQTWVGHAREGERGGEWGGERWGRGRLWRGSGTATGASAEAEAARQQRGEEGAEHPVPPLGTGLSAGPQPGSISAGTRSLCTPPRGDAEPPTHMTAH